MIDILDELIERLYKAITDADLEMTENTLMELEELGVGWQEAMDMVNEIAKKSTNIKVTKYRGYEKKNKIVVEPCLCDDFRREISDVHV